MTATSYLYSSRPDPGVGQQRIAVVPDGTAMICEPLAVEPGWLDSRVLEGEHTSPTRLRHAATPR